LRVRLTEGFGLARRWGTAAVREAGAVGECEAHACVRTAALLRALRRVRAANSLAAWPKRGVLLRAVRAADCAWHARPADARRGVGAARGGGGQRTPVTDWAAQHAGAKRQPLQAEDASSFNVGAQAQHAHGLAEALRRIALRDCRGRTFELSRDRRWDARPARPMMNNTASRAWWPAAGPRLERGVRPRFWPDAKDCADHPAIGGARQCAEATVWERSDSGCRSARAPAVRRR
jgi:hypothetical protein